MLDDEMFRMAERMHAQAAEIERLLQPALEQHRWFEDQLRAVQADLGLEHFRKTATDLADAKARFEASLAAFEIPTPSTDWLVMPPTERDEIRKLHNEIADLRRLIEPPGDDEPHNEIKGFRP